MPENHKPSSTTKSKAETAVTDSDNIENDVDSVDDKDVADVDTEIDDIDDDELNDSETASTSEADESLKEDIGKKINQLRLAKGYSQRKLAKLSGLTNTSISSIERNKVSPAVNTLKAILTVLGSDLTTFF
ncbi:helix-turn-helix domain-containing protein [Psychrobacter sp. JCM 18900]|nr:putrescine utilization regulator [Psychrobacter sp. JCM 18900]